MALMKKKPVQAAIAVALAAGIVLAGTFAWSSFNQSRINVLKELMVPDVNLHDDFEGGPNKDVYVENSGGSPIYLRVRLTEFMQTDGRGSLVEGHVRDDAKAYLWAPHNATDKVEACVLAEPNHTSPGWNGENFHDYYTWSMGGQAEANPTAQIYYKPATAEQKSIFAEDGTTVIQEPQVVSDPLTGTSTAGDASVDYTASVTAKIEELRAADTGDPKKTDAQLETEALAELGLKKTQTAYVITMADWISGKGVDGDPDYRPAFAQGDFWVIDQSDGWAYWANALPGGAATGLLLDRVDRTEKQFDSNAEYAINAWLQAVTEDDLGQFAANGGGISDNGMKLLQLATGKIAIAADGAIYQSNGDGTYTLSKNADGSAAVDPKAFVALGDAGVNTPAENRLEIGQRVTIDELTWDGSDYTDYTTQAAKTGPWYNLTKSAVTNAAQDGGKQLYEVTGTQIGADKQVYLKLAPIVEADGAFVADVNTTLYLASVAKDTTSGAYSQTTPGTAPFGYIWPNANGGIGTSTDGRLDPTVTLDTRSFTLLGNGVYLETTDSGTSAAAEGAATPVTYFFAGKNITKTDVTGATGATDAKVNALFPLQLAVGDKFDITGGTTTGGTTAPVTGYTKSESGAYTMSVPVKGLDGNYYIYLGSAKAGYIGPGADKFLAGTTSDVRTWDGGMGIGSSTDSTTAPSDFSEGFLNGKTSEDLAEGKTLTVDGYNWTVVEVDEFGNRLLLTDTGVSSMGTSVSAKYGNYPYASTNWPTRATAFTNTLTSLKPYAMGVNIPAEQPYTAADLRTAADGLSTCASSKTGATAFVPSASDINTYLYNGTAEVKAKLYNGAVYATRSQVMDASGGSIETAAVYKADGTFGGSTVGLGTGTGSYACYYDQLHTSNYPPRMAIWVRFSDAESVATASAERLNAWKAGPPAAGTKVTLDSQKFQVLKVEGDRVFLATESTVSQSAFRTDGGSGYAGSAVQAAVTAWYTSLPADGKIRSNALKPTKLSNEAVGSEVTEVPSRLAGSETVDVAFLPGYAEWNAYLRVNPGTGTPWWYRNYKGNIYYYAAANNANYGGGNATDIYGVRPVIWVSFNAFL